MNVIIVCKFRSREQLVPVILLVIGEKPDELLEFLIDTLSLAIGLWVVGSGGRRLDPYETPELPGEVSDKLWAPIRDVLPGSAVVPPDMPVVQSGSTHCIKLGVTLDEMSPLPKSIYCNHDGIISVGLRELND